METLIYPQARTISQARRSIKRLLLAAGLASAVAAPVWAAEPPDMVVNAAARDTATDRAVDPESVARANWRNAFIQYIPPPEGCGHASYPNFVWEKVDCKKMPPGRSTHRKMSDDQLDDAGIGGNDNVTAPPDLIGFTGKDYLVKTTGLIHSAIGSFQVHGVKSEYSSGLPFPGYIVGNDEYTIQLNTNNLETTSACQGGSSRCKVWQQFAYATGVYGPGTAALYMEYWLRNYGSSCPDGYHSDNNSNCYMNSNGTELPSYEISDLCNPVDCATMFAFIYNDTDYLFFAYGVDLYSVSGSDTVLNIASVWNKVEFNIFGDGNGETAVFNPGTSIDVNLELEDGTNYPPEILRTQSTTAESNNLNLGSRSTSSKNGGLYATFSESN